MVAALFITFVVCLFVGIPVAFSLGVASLVYFLGTGMPIIQFTQRFFAGMDAAVTMLRRSDGSPDTTEGTSRMSGPPSRRIFTAVQLTKAEFTSIWKMTRSMRTKIAKKEGKKHVFVKQQKTFRHIFPFPARGSERGCYLRAWPDNGARP